MQLARVIGEVVATIKDDNLTGIKLMVLQPIAASGDPAGRTLVALDSVGAGVGEHVFFVRGREAAFPFYPVEPPTDACDRRHRRSLDGRMRTSWLPPSGGRMREAIHRFATAAAFRLKPEATAR